MRSADDTNLSNCIAVVEEDQNMIWEELDDLEGRLSERDGWVLTVTRSKRLHLETKVEVCLFKVTVEKGPELVYLSTAALKRMTAVVIYLMFPAEECSYHCTESSSDII